MEEELHPLETMGKKDVEKAYNIVRVFFIIAAVLFLVGGIVLLLVPAFTDGPAEMNAIWIVSGLGTIVVGPLLLHVIWTVEKIAFMLYHNVNDIKDRVNVLEDLALMQAKNRDK